mmetsp:Transcript_2622/g.7732  ORF Transcript_2622/g.7732 Transcript_2622/m.7732 type:complete len:315 (+) Transcript_2622:273-1217(+)
MARVRGARHLRHVGCCHAPRLERGPVEGAKPGVHLHVRGAPLQVAATLARARGEEGRHKPARRVPVRAVRRQRRDGRLEDVAVHLHGRARHEGGAPREHLVDEHAQGPPVHRAVVAPRRGKHLRSHVFGRAAERVRALALLLPYFRGEAEVREFAVAAPVQQQVLWLEVTIGDVPRPHVLESQHDACRVELARPPGKPPPRTLHEAAEELPAGAELGDEVERVAVVEGGVQAHDVGVAAARQQPPLLEHVCPVLALAHRRLRNHLERADDAGRRRAGGRGHEENAAIGADAEHGDWPQLRGVRRRQHRLHLLRV